MLKLSFNPNKIDIMCIVCHAQSGNPEQSWTFSSLIKAPQFYTDLGLQSVLNTPVNGKIQGLFKAFECFSSTLQGKFLFQGLFKTVLYIQVLFKPVQTICFYPL